MRMLSIILYLGLIGLVSSIQNVLASRDACNCCPNSPCWPSSASWAALNRTVSGQLIKTVPAAAVCYSGPLYNSSACESVQKNWHDSRFHLERPESIFTPARANESCNPVPEPPVGESCELGYYPWYVVNATTAEHVSAAVKFAKKHRIRLVVKATGHDFLGRSTGYGSLSTWTRHLKGITYNPTFKPKKCRKAAVKTPVFTFGAGHVWLEAYIAGQTRNLTFAGGTVGSISVAGGHPQGGGHGFLSREHGLAADQPVEFEVVLADGKIVTVNECLHPELFFALRGGGGGTWGVVTKVSIKAYPSYPLKMHTLLVQFHKPVPAGPPPKIIQDLTTILFNYTPTLADGGMAGHFYILGSGMAFWSLLQVQNGKYTKFPTEIIAPLIDRLSAPEYSTIFNVTAFEYPVENHLALMTSTADAEGNRAGGGITPATSWLLTQKLASSSQRFGSMIKDAFPSSDSNYTGAVMGHLIAGGKVSDASVGNAVLPAWRRVLLQIFVLRMRVSGKPSKEELKEEEKIMSNVYGKALRKAEPGSGAYMNEADYNQPDWQWAFFGENWEKLSDIKRKYDPEDVFYCHHCVGSEKFTETDGRLCKKRVRGSNRIFGIQ